ncbi:hypothetical protein MHBO_003323 [Bonamia ostreae]|uniref:Transmembrane protein n=1 Tax=Bonamia ostreae TaxID=126728 RepID=A0ABV2AQP3_9EUKA
MEDKDKDEENNKNLEENMEDKDKDEENNKNMDENMEDKDKDEENSKNMDENMEDNNSLVVNDERDPLSISVFVVALFCLMLIASFGIMTAIIKIKKKREQMEREYQY